MGECRKDRGTQERTDWGKGAWAFRRPGHRQWKSLSASGADVISSLADEIPGEETHTILFLLRGYIFR
jgi:hypothetical protein